MDIFNSSSKIFDFKNREGDEKKMIISTTENIPGYKIKEYVGLVRGNAVLSRNVGVDIAAGLKTIVGGEIKGYRELLTRSRELAMERMTDEAENLNADAVITVRLATSQIMSGAAEIVAYGTAVRIEKI